MNLEIEVAEDMPDHVVQLSSHPGDLIRVSVSPRVTAGVLAALSREVGLAVADAVDSLGPAASPRPDVQ